MEKVLISGGQGDIAQAIKELLEKDEKYIVYAPSKTEMDVTDKNSVSAYISKIKPEIMINNAGYVLPQGISNADITLEEKSIQINLLGIFYCTHETLKHNPSGKIINIGSSAASKVHAGWSSYCATKAAVVMATKCWAEEGVKTICLSPGRTQTKMRSTLFANENPDTLLKPEEFAFIVEKAINNQYPNGTHLDVTVSNIKELLK